MKTETDKSTHKENFSRKTGLTVQRTTSVLQCVFLVSSGIKQTYIIHVETNKLSLSVFTTVQFTLTVYSVHRFRTIADRISCMTSQKTMINNITHDLHTDPKVSIETFLTVSCVVRMRVDL